MVKASHYTTLSRERVRCTLCPHYCHLEEGEVGKCLARVNRNGELYTENYGVLSSISADPVEKKPLYHFLPGSTVLSIGSFGCNMSCSFCQNCEISQISHRILSHHPVRDPEDIVRKADLHPGNIGLAYTYNEPTVYFEYMHACATRIREQGLRNMMVTNGYISPEPLAEILPLTDAWNVDLKSFTNRFYREQTGTALKPVLRTIETIAGSNAHLELTFLIIPGLNDTEAEWEKMIRWIETTCGPETVLHVSRYFPSYQLSTPPTPIRTIERFIRLAEERINYVYPGNTPRLSKPTRCPGCSNILIERNAFRSTNRGITENGRCSQCNRAIYGVFKPSQS